MKIRNWEKYPLRLCYSVHFCKICGFDIILGQHYFDGGYRRRAHKECVLEINPMPAFIDP